LFYYILKVNSDKAHEVVFRTLIIQEICPQGSYKHNDTRYSSILNVCYAFLYIHILLSS